MFDLPTLFPFPSLSTPTDKISIKRYHQDTSCCVSGLVLKWKICLLTTFYCNKMPDILLTRSVVTCKQRYCWLSELVIYLMLSFGFSPMIFCNQIQNKLARHLVLKKEILFFFQLKSIKKKIFTNLKFLKNLNKSSFLDLQFMTCNLMDRHFSALLLVVVALNYKQHSELSFHEIYLNSLVQICKSSGIYRSLSATVAKNTLESNWSQRIPLVPENFQSKGSIAAVIAKIAVTSNKQMMIHKVAMTRFTADLCFWCIFQLKEIWNFKSFAYGITGIYFMGMPQNNH